MSPSYPEIRADDQACHAAYEVIDETAVYNCTGNPHPKDIERVVQSMMSDEFGTSYSCKSALPLCPLLSLAPYQAGHTLGIETDNTSHHLIKDRKRSSSAGYDFRSIRILANGRYTSSEPYIPIGSFRSMRVSPCSTPLHSTLMSDPLPCPPTYHRLMTCGIRIRS